MAFFKTIDFLKRNNAEVLISIVLASGQMTLGKKADGQRVQISNSIDINGIIWSTCEENFDTVLSEFKEHCLTVKGAPPELEIDWENEDGSTWVPVTRFFKDPRFVPKSRNKSAPEVRDKEYQQRQEKSLVEIINTFSQPVQIDNFQYKISRANQAPDFGPHGKENLVDIVVWDEHNFSYNVSCKMSKAADLGSGGIAGLKRTVPDLVDKVYTQVQTDLYGMGLQEGNLYSISYIPTILYSISYTYALKMFQGCDSVGGKIDYLYIGPDKVDYSGAGFNGKFWSVEEYAKKKPYYLRLRKRNVFNSTVKINFNKMNSHGLPCIFTSGAGDFSAARFVVDDRVPPNAVVRELL